MPAKPPPICPQLLTARGIWRRRREFHVVTYAEEGFAPLNIYAEGTGVEKDELAAFADAVNRRNEAGSLFPRAAISAIPRAMVRGRPSKKELRDHIAAFLEANRTSIRAQKVMFDFSSPRVSPFIVAAIEVTLAEEDCSNLSEVVIVIG